MIFLFVFMVLVRADANTDIAAIAKYNLHMSHQNPSDSELKQLLTDASTIAMVGASSNPDKAAYGIMQKLQSVGYRVIPVNPRESEILGECAFPSLSDIPEKIDIVDVFRRPEDTPAIADEAVKIGAKAIWLQTGISNEETATRAEAGGLKAVMDQCIGATHALLQVPRKERVDSR
jgi:predicted CoA-binding protein